MNVVTYVTPVCLDKTVWWHNIGEIVIGLSNGNINFAVVVGQTSFNKTNIN